MYAIGLPHSMLGYPPFTGSQEGQIFKRSRTKGTSA